MMKSDGWTNILTSMGTSRDSRTQTKFTGQAILGMRELELLYQFDGLSRRVIDAVPDAMLREPFVLEGDTDNKVWSYMERIKADCTFRKALKWARLYGGAVVLMMVQDGKGWDVPLNPKSVRSLESLKVYDRWCVVENPSDWQNDPQRPRYGMREFYTIQPRFGTALMPFRAHHSRVLAFDGRDVPDQARIINQGWGDSELTAVHNEIRRYATSLDSADAMLHDFVQASLTIRGLTDILSRPDGDKLVKDRLEILDMSRHMLNTMLLDEGEVYDKRISSVTGVSDIIDRMASAVSAVVNIPQSLLFGKTGGSSLADGKGDNEIRQFYDSVRAEQRRELGPALQQVITVINSAQDGPGLPPPYNVRFAPLWQPTQLETSQARRAQADTDAIYIDKGVLDPLEVAQSRFGGHVYSFETSIDVNARSRELEPPLVDKREPDGKPEPEES